MEQWEKSLLKKGIKKGENVPCFLDFLKRFSLKGMTIGEGLYINFAIYMYYTRVYIINSLFTQDQKLDLLSRAWDPA